MIYDRFREKKSLNGLWKYAVDQYDTCIRQKWNEEVYYDAGGNTLPVDFSFDEWETIELPCSWNTVDRMYKIYDGSMVFTRKFIYSCEKEGERVILRIGAANYLCRVFLNRQYIGMHCGGSTPCCFDITEYLQHDNRIILQVDSTRRNEQVPTANTDWFNYGGVYRNIDLIRVPAVHVRDLRVALEPDGTFHNIRARVDMSRPVSGEAVLTINELGIKQTFQVANGSGEILLEAAPELWSPENPRLYDVELSCCGDEVRDRVDLRSVLIVWTARGWFPLPQENLVAAELL